MDLKRLFIVVSVLGTGAIAPVFGQCTADAGPATAAVCGGQPLTLSGSGTGAAPLSYSWSGSSNITNGNSANATFLQPVPVNGALSVNLTLTVTDANGCVATDAIAVTVNVTPRASLTSPDGNPDLYIAPDGSSFALCGTGLGTYAFQFADASTAQPGASYNVDWGTPPSPYAPPAGGWSQNHDYPIGLHTINYTVSGPGACSHTATYSVFLGSNPSVGTSNPGNTVVCSGTELVFPLNNTSGNSPGTIYEVDYGDGNGTSFTHPPPASVSYGYPNTNCPGAPYIFRVDAITPCPITSFATAGPIYITDQPQASFTMSTDTACANSSVTFTNTSTGVGGPGCTQPLRVWSISPATGWNATGLGALNGSTQPNQWTNGSNSIGVQFTQPGTYCITLNVGNNLCGTDEVEHCVCIEGPPQPAFTMAPQTGCAPFTGIVDNTSASPNSCLTTFDWSVTTSGGACGSGPAWNFTGGTNASSVEPQFQFTQAGTYSVRLEATNSCGTFQQTEVITAHAPPQVEVAALGAGTCAGDCVDPSAVVQDCGAPIDTYAWSFSGGTPNTANTLAPPSICYNTATSSTISLTVTNACGSATDVTTLGVGTVPAAPVIASNSPVCAGQILSLSANAIPGLTYQWTGPNGFSSDQPAVTIQNVTAASAGTYQVVAITNGCAGPSATVDVQIIPAPALTVTPSSAAICNGASASFTVSGAGNYQWYIGNTLVGTGPLFNTSPAISTTYTVTGSTGGCPGSATVPVTVFPITNVNAGADRIECDQAIPVNLNGFPSPGTWSGTNVTSAGVFTPVPDQLGPMTLTYTHVDGNGCTNSDQMVITVQDLVVVADAGNDVTLCEGGPAVNLPASPAGGTWSGATSNGLFTPSAAGSFTATYSYGTGTCATSDQVGIEVLPAPVLNLSAVPTLCIDAAAVPLNATPIGGTWSGDGVNGPPYTFDPALAGTGSHTLTYSYTDAAGCTSANTVQAIVNALPVVDAGSDVQLCDQPIPFQLSASPSGGTWSANTFNVTPQGAITPAGVGSDVLTYGFVDGAGCSGSDQITVTVVPITEPAFAGNDTAVCVNSGALQLVGSPAGGSWSGAGVSSSGEFAADVVGSFTLTYAHGAETCLIQDQVTVVVHVLPVVDAGPEIALCQDDGAQVLMADPPGGSWSGTGVDAAGNFDPMQALPGGNTVNYAYTDPATGCSNSTSTLVTVNPLPQAAMDHDPVACVNVPFAFVNSSSGATAYEWDFGDGTTSFSASPQHSYTVPGTYDVRLIAITGADCRDTVYSSLEVWEGPQASFALTTELGCGPLEVDFTNTSTGEGLSFAWEFGGLGGSAEEAPGPFTFPPAATDSVSYPITLTVTNACGQVTADGEVTVLPLPVAEFGPSLDMYCSSAPVPFGNASYGAPSFFEWQFGDGAISNDNGSTVTHVYVTDEDPMEVTVMLVAGNICGSDTAYRTITILPNQVNAFFNADPVQGCAPVTVELTQFSVGDTAFYWDLGDGNISSAHDLSWTYPAPGTYAIELFAFGCGSDSMTTEITVFPGPAVDFTFQPTSACAGLPFQFDGTATDVSGVVWDFGDGEGSTLSDPEHVFTGSGTFQVSLTGTAVGSGCTTTVTQPVLVLAAPQASFVADPMTGCVPLEVTFDNTSNGTDYAQWDFGDGNSSANMDPFHTYAIPGTYQVRLVAEAQNDCRDTAYTTIIVYPLPVAGFELSQYSSCESSTTVQTINTSSGAIGYVWDLGNGTTSGLNQPDVTYTQPGNYPITLTVTDQHGCADSATDTFIQYPTPAAAFTTEPEPGCAGYPIAFLNGSVNGVGYHWNFGDGHTSNTDFPLHTYAVPGVYDVGLITFGAGGCSDTLEVVEAVHVLERPLAAFAYDTLQSIAHALQFRNESEGAVSYTWDFGDGETTEARHPIHIFPADGGGFVVCLVAVNDLGCPDTVCTSLYVPGDPNIFVPNAFTPNDDARNDTFRPILNGFVGWNYRFMVFDRWGLPAFDTRDRNVAWDGTRNGVDSPVDVYVWKVVVERDGDARDFTGHVSLVR
ncbi:MAG TPA: PKD domain-containing protein [Flavobacteriales bacterium]|nr:PKD domain-containing protein [Flavobacteriales bacterium]